MCDDVLVSIVSQLRLIGKFYNNKQTRIRWHGATSIQSSCLSEACHVLPLFVGYLPGSPIIMWDTVTLKSTKAVFMPAELILHKCLCRLCDVN